MGLSKKGPLYRTRYYLLRLSEEFYERWYGIRTKAWLKPEQLGIENVNACDYVPMPYRVLHQIFSKLDIRAGSAEVLLDMGCGMGRPLAVASRYPFRRIVGVVISPKLCKVAHTNLTHCQPGARCPEFEVVNANASRYALPDDVTVVFFNNPFRGKTLRRVIENLRQSLVRRPRSSSWTLYYADANLAAAATAGPRAAEGCQAHDSERQT